jgi:hypothetical protein
MSHGIGAVIGGSENSSTNVIGHTPAPTRSGTITGKGGDK